MASTIPSGNQRMTRGGRAWSEQETRENKMPYKQIAHQLKKTELACRLHFHQLVRNSARGRRNRGSVSSMSDLSPEMEAAGPSASTFRKRRAPHRRTDSDSSMSTTSSREYYLPRITESSADSARQHIILPRPAAMPDDSAYTNRTSWRPHSVAEEFAPLHDQYQHYHHRTPSLPPQREMMPLPLPSTAADMPAHVDLPRLHAIYDAHRGAFWNHIASEYGYNTPPEMLEDAWRAGVYGGVGVQQYPGPSFNRPMTPVSSPEAERRHHGVDRTRISSIISGDDDACLADRR